MKRNNIFKTIALIALCTISTAIFPTVARAEEEEPKSEGIHLNKTAEYNEVDKKGLITLSSFVEGEVKIITTSVPFDVVLVLDNSVSMDTKMGSGTRLTNMKVAAEAFVKQVDSCAKANKVEHRIALVSLSGTTTTEIKSDFSSDYANLISSIKGLGIGATGTNYNLAMALTDGLVRGGDFDGTKYVTEAGFTSVKKWDYSKKNLRGARNRKFTYVLFFTDGQPEGTGSPSSIQIFYNATGGKGNASYFLNNANDALWSAKQLKQSGVTIYSVSVGINTLSTNTSKFCYNMGLNAISSNHPDATNVTDYNITRKEDYPAKDYNPYGYYRTADDKFTEIFTDISSEIISSSPAIELGYEAVIKDFINKSYFKLPDNTKPENIKVYKAPFTGFNDKKEFMFNDTTGRELLSIADLKEASGIENPIQVLTDDKGYQYVSVQGFNFSENFCAMAGDTPRGCELIVEIPFEFIGTGQSGDLPTNTEESGIYTRDPITGEDTKLDPYPVPHIVFCTLNITRTNLLRGETAIYSIRSNKYGTEVCRVTLSAPEDGMILKESVVGLPEGTYTVEETNWNWAYDKSGETRKTVVVQEGPSNNAIFQGSHINGTGDDPAEMHNHDEAFKSNIMIIPPKTN